VIARIAKEAAVRQRRTLAPALLLLALLSISVSRAAEPAASTGAFLPLVVKPGANGLSFDEQFVLDAVNAERAKVGCPALRWNDTLKQAARAHSDDMAQRDYFNHTDPDGVGPAERAKAAGYSGQYVGENVAAGQNSGQVVMYHTKYGWMYSESHKTNILNCNYSETGIALTYDPNDKPTFLVEGKLVAYYYYWTQVFGNPSL
jgi:uncharacterized protein YkwD